MQVERSISAKQALTPDREVRAQTDIWADLTPDELADKHRAVLAMMETEGWTVYLEAVKRDADAIMRRLIDRTKPLDDVADYEGQLGEVRGLERHEAITDGLILLGQEAERVDD